MTRLEKVDSQKQCEFRTKVLLTLGALTPMFCHQEKRAEWALAHNDHVRQVKSDFEGRSEKLHYAR